MTRTRSPFLPRRRASVRVFGKDMKRIPVRDEHGIVAYAKVDDADYEKVSPFKWSINGKAGYAVRGLVENGKARTQLMHRLIMDAPEGSRIDHVNGDKLDNRRRNLRFATRSQNAMNKGKPKNNTSGFKGVSWYKKAKKWCARIKVNGKTIHLGLFAEIKIAARAYDAAARELHGEFAYTNFK